MTRFYRYSKVLPASWASPLINGDYTGCTDEEEREIAAFLRVYPDFGLPTTADEDDEFGRNDWDNSLGPTTRYHWLLTRPARRIVRKVKQ